MIETPWEDYCGSLLRPRDSVRRFMGLGIVRGLVLLRTKNFYCPRDVLRLRLASLDLLFGLSVPDVSIRSLFMLFYVFLAETMVFNRLATPTFFESELKYFIVVVGTAYFGGPGAVCVLVTALPRNDILFSALFCV